MIPDELRSVPLASLAPDDWFTDRKTSSFWLRVYTSLFISHNRFEELVADFVAGSGKKETFRSLDQPILFAAGAIRDFHKGVRPLLTADVERYLQLLFLELL